MAEVCKYGLQRPFCSLCTRNATGPKPSRTLATQSRRLAHVVNNADAASIALGDVVAYLNAAQVRATYGAVAEVVGGIARSIGARLGGGAGRRAEASWVVNAETEMPTGFLSEHRHPALTANPHIIRTGEELRRRVVKWKAAGAPSRTTLGDPAEIKQ